MLGLAANVALGATGAGGGGGTALATFLLQATEKNMATTISVNSSNLSFDT